MKETQSNRKFEVKFEGKFEESNLQLILQYTHT